MKVVKALEENGAVVVAYENCGGTKSVDRLIDESAEDIYEAIAERYLQIGCSVMTPNKNRYELIERLIEEYQIDGVVEMTLQACHTYNVEAKSIEKFVKEKVFRIFMWRPTIHRRISDSLTREWQHSSRCCKRRKRHLWHLHIYMCIRSTVCWMVLVRLKNFCRGRKSLEWIVWPSQTTGLCMA